MKENADFAIYLKTLIGSWKALAVPHPGAVVVAGDGFYAARFPDHPVLNNAVILAPAGIDAARSIYAQQDAYAMWSLEDHPAAPPLAGAMEAAGWTRDITTRPMLQHLDAPAGQDRLAALAGVVRDVDPAVVAGLNGVPADLLRGVPGLRTYATSGNEAGLAVIAVAQHVNVSFVATRPDARRRGFAGALTVAALREARSEGYRSASLQATAMAEGVYARTGFVTLGRWQEWLPS